MRKLNSMHIKCIYLAFCLTCWSVKGVFVLSSMSEDLYICT